MPDTQLQMRRNTASVLDTKVPADGEWAYDTTNDEPRIGDAVTSGGVIIPNYKSIITCKYVWATVGGTADAITLALPRGSPPYTGGFSVRFKALATNTGAVTAAIDGKTALNVYKVSGGTVGALAAGDIVNGGVYELIHDGTQLQLFNIAPPQANLSGLKLLQVATASGASQIDFTGITSDHEEHLIALQIGMSSTSADLYLRMSFSGSFDTGSNYSNQYNVLTGTSTVSGGGSGSDAYMLIGKYAGGGGSSAMFTGEFNTQNISGINPSMRSELNYTQISTGARQMFGKTIGAAVRRTTTLYDGIRIFPSTGSISGKAKLYGLAKSL